MKETRLLLRLTGLLLLFYCLPLSGVQAQTEREEAAEERELLENIDQDHDKTLKLHPLHYGEIYLSYEKVRAPNISNEFGLSYIYKSYFEGDTWASPEAQDALGIAIRMSQRYYTSKVKKAPFGFFHGPQFNYRFVVFERNVFDLQQLPPSDPNYRFVGRLYQNALDLSYHLGYQFQLGQNFTAELSGGIGGRLKFAKATNGGDLIKENIIGRVLASDEGAVFAITPSPQLNFSIGYSF
ncbi:ABC transporter ATP-binding protein [Pontibacter roseus]|uniref:ABC transporter ATP-binding protein n=1 Tax=Pontibacter roseus TaxID=336989 RepID=UPI0012F774ED|nr:ABC transporter ATP-binding protein [Pontibacter roseus]